MDAVFGGQRRAPGAPTHACPGRDMAMAALLGIFTGLLEAGEWRAAGAPLYMSLYPMRAQAGAVANVNPGPTAA